MLAWYEQPREHIVLHLVRVRVRARVRVRVRVKPEVGHLPSAAAAAAAAAAATTPAAPAAWPAAPSAPSSSASSAAAFPPSRLGRRRLEEEDQRSAQQLVLHVVEPRCVRARREQHVPGWG